MPSTAAPAEVIPWVKKAIARYKEVGSVIPQNVDSYPAWKRLVDDWLQFLEQLENLEKLAKTPPPPPIQQLTKLPTSCQKLPEVATTLPDVASPLPTPCQTEPPIASLKNHPQSANPDPQSSDTEPSKADLEFDDLMDGFATEKERLAAARAEIHAHLANEPVRFAKLTPEQQAAVFALLESGVSTRAVAKLLAEPPPIGASIRVSKTAVGNWRKKYGSQLVAEKNRQKAEAQLQAAAKIVDNNPNADADFQKAAERIFKLRILTSQDAPLETLDQLVETLTTLRKQSLAERKQHHAEQA